MTTLFPSRVRNDYWVHSANPNPPNDWTERSGKWLIFVPLKQIDEKWATIAKETEAGRLGIAAKAATAKPNQFAKNKWVKVICVYTYDSADEADVMRVRDLDIKKLGINLKDWLGKSNEAIAILRISSIRQKGNASHDIQQEEIAQYCAENGLDLIKAVQLIESAKDSDNRKKYTSIIEFALKQKLRHVLFYMFDRETRNLTDNEKNEKLVRQDKIVLHYTRERKILFRGSPDSDFFLRDIQAVSNKQFIRNLSAKVIDSMRAKAESGWYPGNHPPLGYINQRIRDEDGREQKRGTILVRDSNSINVQQVFREFELRAQGYSFGSIRDQIISENLISTRRIKQYRPGIIEKRIKNPIYFGKFVWDGIEYQGNHELIIPKSIRDQILGMSAKRYGSTSLTGAVRTLIGLVNHN